MPQLARPQLNMRRSRLADLIVQGYSNVECAKELGVSEAQISRDRDWLKTRWEQAALQNIDYELGRSLATWAYIQREALAGWRRSQAQKEISTTEATEEAGTGTGSAPGLRRKATVRKEGQVGDHGFLTVAANARTQEDRLRGLMPAQKVKVDFARLTDDQLLRVAQGEQIERVLAGAPLALPMPQPPQDVIDVVGEGEG